MLIDVIMHVAHDQSKSRRVKPSCRIVRWTRAGIVAANQMRGQHRGHALHEKALGRMSWSEELTPKCGYTATDQRIVCVEHRHEIDSACAPDFRHGLGNQTLRYADAQSLRHAAIHPFARAGGPDHDAPRGEIGMQFAFALLPKQPARARECVDNEMVPIDHRAAVIEILRAFNPCQANILTETTWTVATSDAERCRFRVSCVPLAAARRAWPRSR